VSTTPQLDVLDRGPATRRAREHVVELQEAAFAAVPAVAADERAAAAIPDEDRPLRLRRDVSGVSRALPRSRTVGQRELLLEQVVQEGIERAREDLSRVAVRNRMTQQILDELELPRRLLARRERDPVTVWRQGTNERRRRRREGDTGRLQGRRRGRRVQQRRRRRRGGLGYRRRTTHRGQLPDGGRYVRHREPPRQQLLHLALSLARGLREQLFMVVPRQVGREEPDRRQVQAPRSEQPEDCRMTSDDLGRLHAVVGLVLREEQHPRAIREEGSEPGPLVQPAAVQLGQVRDQGRGRLALTPGETRDLGLELAIGETRWSRVRHAHTSHAADLRSRCLSPDPVRRRRTAITV